MANTVTNAGSSTITNTTNNTANNTANNKRIGDPTYLTRTERGTKIVKPGQDLDKNAFLRILSAELTHQDPQSAKDGTEYVTQMAQFAGLEQMANLNTSMRITGANSFIGKYVTLRKLDERGNLYNGEVRNITKNGDEIKLNVVVGKEKDDKGNIVDKLQEFNMEDVIKLEDFGDIFNPVSNNMMLLNAAALIGKTVELSEKDSNNKNYHGVVEEVSRGVGGIKLKVNVGENEPKEIYFDEVVGVK